MHYARYQSLTPPTHPLPPTQPIRRRGAEPPPESVVGGRNPHTNYTS